MLLQSKNPQPRPKTIRPAMAMPSVPAFPTLKRAGRNNTMPMALVKIRPRAEVRIQRSASVPPITTPTIEASCT